MSVFALSYIVLNCFLRVQAATLTGAYDPIVFPGPVKDIERQEHDTTDHGVSEECLGQNFCSVKPPDYPQTEFDEIFKKKKLLFVLQSANTTEVGNRLGDPDERDDCRTTVTFEAPYKVRTTEGEWRTVVQSPDHDFVQRIRLEICLDEKGSCFKDLAISSDYVTFCKQKYITWEMLVAKGNGGTEVKKTDLPICCSCHYMPADLASKFGKPTTTPVADKKKN